MKKTFLTACLLLTMTTVCAQHFEWVRGYASGDFVSVVGSVTDSEGNLYILGSINFNTCWENGSRLLPIVPYGNAQDQGDALIAKISPDGDLVWHKVIHGSYSHSLPHDIKPLGDSAFACLVTMPLASLDDYLYYLDTMIYEGTRGWDHSTLYHNLPYPDYPMSVKGRGLAQCLALITFDFDGHVREQHFLQLSYLDAEGNDIIYRTPPPDTSDWLAIQGIMYPSFAIDGEGNIFLSHSTYNITSAMRWPESPNQYRVEDGTISAFKFWCDRREVGVVPADSTLAFSPQILKFSPHFDTLIGSRYVFQEDSIAMTSFTHLEIDKENRLYLNSEMYPSDNWKKRGNVAIDSTQNMKFYLDAYKNNWKSIIVRYSDDLNANRLVSLEDTIIDYNNYWGTYEFNDIAFDDEKGLVFVSGWPCRNAWGHPENEYSYFTFDGIQTSFNINAFVLVLDKETMNLESYGQLNSPYCSRIVQPFTPHGNLVCGNNRIFFQSDYSGNLHYPEQVLQAPVLAQPGMCLNILDYNGNMIEGFDYHSYSTQNRTGPIQLYDSTLYLCAQLTADATFGDISMSYRGKYTCFIAKYTDPAFTRPYVSPDDTTIRVEVVQEELTVVRYPNPTTGRLTIVMNGRPLREAYVAGMDGIARLLAVMPTGGDCYAADLSDRPDGTYILVLVADDHRAYRSTVILQR